MTDAGKAIQPQNTMQKTHTPDQTVKVPAHKKKAALKDSPTPNPNKYWLSPNEIIPNPEQGVVLVITESNVIGAKNKNLTMAFGFYGPDHEWHVLQESGEWPFKGTSYAKSSVVRWMPLPGWPKN